MPSLPAQSRPFLSQLAELTQKKNSPKGKALHARIIRNGRASCLYIANGLVNLYAKCGDLRRARLVFENVGKRDVVSWNCLINGCSQVGPSSPVGSSAVMELLRRMMGESILPNAHTFAGVFAAASGVLDVSGGRQAQAVAVKTGCFGDVFVGSSLLNLYCKARLVFDARKVFDGMLERNLVSWATMISGYATQRMAKEALELFGLVRVEEHEGGNEFIFTSLLSAFTFSELVDTGKQIHGLALKYGLLCFVAVGNALVTMYSKCGKLDDALQMFKLYDDKNSITWSAMVTGFAQSGDFHKALKLFSSMHFSGISPSEFTFVGVINACSDLGALEEGKQIHGYSLKSGFESQMYVMTALVDMYAKCGSTSDARKGFDYLREPDIVLWTSMIGGYVTNGENEAALSLYCTMQMEGLMPNELTMASVLKACSSLAALEQGKQIHGRTIKYGFGLEIPIGSALSTMYAKCGSLEDGNKVFRRMPTRDVISWNAMISGLSHNGHGNEAHQLFDEMLLEGTKPDAVTFVNVLSACSHMGLVDRGWSYFNMMFDDFGIAPKVEHYACMVDVLSRAGKLNEAKEFIESAPIDHGMCLWRILLCACRNYRDFELGTYAGEKLMELGSQESSAYVLLSSIYTSLGRKEDVQRVRRMMKLRGVSKEPGCSWIELKSRVHVFVVGDELHPHIGDIRNEIRRLWKHMKDEGYLPLSELTSAYSFTV
ncbi:Tetratricopeptide-like helical domain containing protein [Trema orientale]|uniref:Tetratricopeptide-like helical domain containing protein n=1 Tax=Trema orientale TaxID=63057 RepID=A0A2P5E8D5_TREOI|nr:Tetratricopeptide-like helical domain containing protein [Trema orientale]